MDQFAWSKEEALYYMGILMSVGAVVACATFLLIGPLCDRYKENNVLIWGGFFLMVIGRISCIPYGDELAKINYGNYSSINLNGTDSAFDNDDDLGCPIEQEWCLTTPKITITQFILGYAFTSVGYPIGITLIQTVFSKVLGPRPQVIMC
jgi:ceroid-lipofuscinosis MFS transporter 7